MDTRLHSRGSIRRVGAGRYRSTRARIDFRARSRGVRRFGLGDDEAPPANTAPPTITGTAAVGQTLTAQNGTWTNSPTAFQYRWRRCDTAGAACVNIAGAIGAGKTYTVVAADAGHTLRVVVTAVNADGARSAVSAQTAVVSSPGAPDNTGRPTITGTAEEGQTLTASEGTWTGSPASFAYQWQQCDSDGSNCGNIVRRDHPDLHRPCRGHRLPAACRGDGHERARARARRCPPSRRSSTRRPRSRTRSRRSGSFPSGSPATRSTRGSGSATTSPATCRSSRPTRGPARFRKRAASRRSSRRSRVASTPATGFRPCGSVVMGSTRSPSVQRTSPD